MRIAIDKEDLKKADITHLFPGDCPVLDFWKALSILCLREYWTRTWIIQELGLALVKQTVVIVYCGSERMNWDTFKRLGAERSWRGSAHLSRTDIGKGYWDYDVGRVSPFHHRDLDDQARNQVFHYRKAISASTFERLKDWDTRATGANDWTGRTLAYLLDTYSESVCSDPRDKVYALLSLAKDCQNGSNLQADYSKDVATLFWDVMDHSRPADAVSFGRMLQHSLGLPRRALEASASQRPRQSISLLQQPGARVPMNLDGIVTGVRSWQPISEVVAAPSDSEPCMVFSFHKMGPGNRIHHSNFGVTQPGVQLLDKIYSIADADLRLIVRRAKFSVSIVGRAVVTSPGSPDEAPEAMMQRFQLMDRSLVLELEAASERAKHLTIVLRDQEALVRLMMEPSIPPWKA